MPKAVKPLVDQTPVEEGISKEDSFATTSTTRRKGHKRKVKRKDESLDDEVIVPRHIHIRGQARRSRNNSNAITSERQSLDSGTFLHYLMNLWSAFPEEKVKSVAYFDPLWFNLYASENNQVTVLNWIKEKDIFSKKYVLVPIVKWLLFDIYKSEGRPESKQQLKKVPLLIPKVPQQKQGEECGFYVLLYINQFIERAPVNFDQSEGYPYFMKMDWFSVEDVETFCKSLDAFPVPVISDHDSASSMGSVEIIDHL